MKMTNANTFSNCMGFFPVGKAVVAANDTAEAIASLRERLENDQQTYVNSDGTMYNPADPATSQNSLTGGGYKPVDKAVVATDTAETIASLREQLENDQQTYVNSDGTVHNPADPATAQNSLTGGGYKPVDKAVVASDTAEAIANLREQLENDQQTYVNSDGTVFNPADPATAQNSLTGGGYKPVDKAVVAEEQWYVKNPALQRAEIQAMKDIKPDAKFGYLPNGKMYCEIQLMPIICGKRMPFNCIMIYDNDHPQICWGGSVKAYPAKPNIREMQAMVDRSHVYPKSIPHLLRDEDGQLYLCSQHKNNIHAGRKQGEKVTTAAACLRYVMRWYTIFALGLMDQTTWTKFQKHGEI